MSNSCIIVPLFLTRNVIAPAAAVPEAVIANSLSVTSTVVPDAADDVAAVLALRDADPADAHEARTRAKALSASAEPMDRLACIEWASQSAGHRLKPGQAEAKTLGVSPSHAMSHNGQVAWCFASDEATEMQGRRPPELAPS